MSDFKNYLFEKFIKNHKRLKKLISLTGYCKQDDMYWGSSDNYEQYVSYEVWKYQQAIINDLKTQLNNMEVCYIQVKKERDDAVYLKNEHRKRRCQLAKELTQKSLRLTEAEFEYKRIKELQAKDCLQIMRLTAKNEKLSDELKALRGEHE